MEKFYQWFWLLPVIFTMRNVEEVVFFRHWLLPEFIKGLVRYQTFLFATIILTFAVVGIVLIEYKVKRPFTLRLSLITINLLLINSLTHIGQFFFAFSYVPGLVTAILLMLPFTIWLLYVVKEKFTWIQLRKVFLLRIFLIPLIIFTTLIFVRMVF